MLNKTAMLVTLSITQPRQSKVDKPSTEKILRESGADRKTAKVVKELFDPDLYRPVKQLINEVRTYHYSRTLPWLDSGQRILSAQGFMTYTEKMREFRAAFEQVSGDFVATYQDQLNAARTRLNGLFRADDYQTPGEVAEQFTFSTTFQPVPDAGDFRVDGIAEAETARIQAEIAARQRQATEQAMKDAYGRLFDAVSHMRDKLTDPDATFRNSLVGNLQELVEILPTLNLTSDPKLEELIRTVEKSLAPVDPQTLRDDKTARKETAKAAQAIVDKMSAFMA